MAGHAIKGRTVLIAGGAKNLGGLLASDLAQRGAEAIAIHGNSACSKADADKTAAAVQAAGATAITCRADPTGATAVERRFADTIEAMGRPDIAIDTVGKVLEKPIVQTIEVEYDEMAAVDAKSAFFCLKEAGRKVNDNGKVCAIAARHGQRVRVGVFPPYAGKAIARNPGDFSQFGQFGIWPHHLGRRRPNNHARRIRCTCC